MSTNATIRPSKKKGDEAVARKPTDDDHDYESDPLVTRTSGKMRADADRDTTGMNRTLLGGWVGIIFVFGFMAMALTVYWKQSTTSHGEASLVEQSGPRTPSRTRPPKAFDDVNDDQVEANNAKKGTFYFDPFAAVQTSNPLELDAREVRDYYAQMLVPPVWNPLQDRDSSANPDARLGYVMQPDTVNGTVAFVSEGDLYLAMWKTDTPDPEASIPAMKLTTTVGNVRDPKINPVYPYLIAYTATYTARRDIYLLDLRRKTHGSQPAMRLTYWTTSSGVRGIVGWKPDGKTLIFQAMSNEVSLPDVRMYTLTLAFSPEDHPERRLHGGHSGNDTDESHDDDGPDEIQPPQVLQIDPVPLSQALGGAYREHEDCWYFTRFQQSSQTMRYQGGTAEAIWSWCSDHQLAVDLTTFQFNGTSKAPSIFSMMTTNKDTKKEEKWHYLLFLSDRGPNNDPSDRNKWKPTTMNLWAVPLPEKDELNDLANPSELNRTWIPSFTPSQFIQLTQVSCEFGGMSLREYSLDPVTQNVVLRIGADLYWMSAESMQKKLREAALTYRRGRFLKDLPDTTAAAPAPKSTSAPVATIASPHHNEAKESDADIVPRDIKKLQILVYSDFHEQQERLISLKFPDDLQSGDVYETAFGTLAFLMTARAQVWVAPVVDEAPAEGTKYGGAGQNLPPRRYRVLPGSKMGGAVRVLSTRHVPVLMEDQTFSRRLALVLATDPQSPTSEHAFYLIETQSDARPIFLSFDDLPKPFLGGHNGGGSVRDGGLGSVVGPSVTVSPCGRRLAWVDTDGRICVMTLPLYKEMESEYNGYIVLPKENELGEPMIGTEAELKWSPGGRYLAVEHVARNQFTIISVVDCGDPLMPSSAAEGDNLNSTTAGITLGRIVQGTPDRFNSFSAYWGTSPYDSDYYTKAKTLAEAYNVDPEPEVATTMLYFLTDRDIVNQQSSPWGPRAPNVWFQRNAIVYGIPLLNQEHEKDSYSGHFSGGGAKELFAERMLDLKSLIKRKRELTLAPSQAPSLGEVAVKFPQDPAIDFGPIDLTFARKAYRLAMIPESPYGRILSQAKDEGSFLLSSVKSGTVSLMIAFVGSFPSDEVEMKEIPSPVDDYGLSTTRNHVYIYIDGVMKVIPSTTSGFSSLMSIDAKKPTNAVNTKNLAVSVWPSLEYQQMFGDAWRMMRDYYYDPEMTGIDWYKMYERYLPLVSRCAKREELDDAMAQMASEVSALHVFVYGGEYNSPLEGQMELLAVHIPATFGVALQRSAAWKGYVIKTLPEIDPDFSRKDGTEHYSPLSERSLRLSGQKVLAVGDVIVAINGESVMHVPDIHMLLRGLGHQSVRLDVLRLSGSEEQQDVKPEPVIAVPLPSADDLLYSAWEYKTRSLAKALAKEAGFTVGYSHLQSMGSEGDINSFYRDFFPDFDKEALIIDVRHNRGGNIDWWLLDVLQRKAWMYWQGRTQNATTGGLGWDTQFSFRGHLVVLVNEKTSSDGEGFSRGVSELGLGKLIGTRTWGGGIWLSSDNTLVDGGIATAPEDGTYNERLGPGLGIEQMGVQPDIVVDNNPHTAYGGTDTQLEHAVEVLKRWIKEEPVVVPKAPAHKRNMALDDGLICGAKR